MVQVRGQSSRRLPGCSAARRSGRCWPPCSSSRRRSCRRWRAADPPASGAPAASPTIRHAGHEHRARGHLQNSEGSLARLRPRLDRRPRPDDAGRRECGHLEARRPVHGPTKLPVGTWTPKFAASDRARFTASIDGPTITISPPAHAEADPDPDADPDGHPAGPPRRPRPGPRRADRHPEAHPAPDPAPTPRRDRHPASDRHPATQERPEPDRVSHGSSHTRPGVLRAAGGLSHAWVRHRTGRRVSPAHPGRRSHIVARRRSGERGRGAGASPSGGPGLIAMVAGLTGGAGTGTSGGGPGRARWLWRRHGRVGTGLRHPARRLGGGGGLLAALARVMPTIVVTTGGVTMAMAFLAFGKRRRDEEPTASDAVLGAAAARGTGLVANSGLGARDGRRGHGRRHGRGQAAVAVAPVPGDLDAHLPRWRRPSLMEARKADPLRSVSSGRASHLRRRGRCGGHRPRAPPDPLPHGQPPVRPGRGPGHGDRRPGRGRRGDPAGEARHLLAGPVPRRPRRLAAQDGAGRRRPREARRDGREVDIGRRRPGDRRLRGHASRLHGEAQPARRAQA